MIVGENKVTQSMVKCWREYWTHNQKSLHTLGNNIAERIIIKKGLALEYITNIIKEHFPNYKMDFAGMQRQSDAHELHMDETGTDRKFMTYTLLIPLEDDKRIKTIIYDSFANTNEDIRNRMMEFGEIEQKLSFKSNLGAQELSHTAKHYKTGQYYADTLELHGVFEYKLGNYVIFDTNLVHSSNNWTALSEWQGKYKEIIQVHFQDLDQRL